MSRPIRHGMARNGFHHRFYRIWDKMLTRCRNPRNMHFRYYGGRGIKVCDSWKTFENFRDDMYQSYLEHVEINGERKTWLDRRDSNGDYHKDNCKWSTPTQQARNKRNNVLYEHEGKKLTASELHERLKVDGNLNAFEARLRHGWDLERAHTQPFRVYKRRVRSRNPL